jgi:hypothetical protein
VDSLLAAVFAVLVALQRPVRECKLAALYRIMVPLVRQRMPPQ